MGYRINRLNCRLIYAIKLKRLIWILYIIFFSLCTIITTFSVQKTLFPIVKTLAQTNAKRTSTLVIYNCVEKVLNECNLKYSDMYNIRLSDEGSINSIEINTPVINDLKANIAKCITKEINNIDSQSIGIPLGNVCNHLFFTGRGPKIPLKLTCSGFTTVDCNSIFTSAGINQTKHAVTIMVKTDVNVLLPYDIITISVETTVPVTETVIVGNVPNLYMDKNIISTND